MITLDRVRELIHYDPITGFFTWNNPSGKKMKKGDKAGWPSRRYWHLTLDSKKYSAHRIAWLYMTGSFPEEEIDHRNCNGKDNSWNNLRASTRSQNLMNTSIRSDNTTGFKGVAIDRRVNKYVAAIYVDGKRKHIGYFDTAEEAGSAYDQEALRHYGSFARTNGLR